MNVQRKLAGLVAVVVMLGVMLQTRSAAAYSVLSHEEVVDMAWKDTIVPMLKARYPGITDDDIRQAHAYAYGGSVIQDIGYYPFGSHYFSDLLHYVRTDDFVNALIRDSKTPDEYAFALGALAHYCGDTVGHPYINEVVSQENPGLKTHYGSSVTYAEDPTAHLRTEFGFDVVEVAQGHYSQENYRDFVGFQVSKTLLEKAFQETYGIPMGDVIKHEDLAISTYRKAVSVLIPKMTKIAFLSYKNQIEAAAPGTERNKFEYRLNQTEYNEEFGTDYTHVNFGGRMLADFLKLLPKVGPLKALRVTVPNAQEQVLYLKSVNQTVDQYKVYLREIKAAPAPLPVPEPKDAEAARKAADKLVKDAAKADKLAGKAKDAGDKAKKAQVAANVHEAAEKADAAAVRTEAKVAAVASGAGVEVAAKAVPVGTPVKAPTVPALQELDMDTGKPAHAGEYKLADQTYAKLLNELVKPGEAGPTVMGAAGTGAPARTVAVRGREAAGGAGAGAVGAMPAKVIDAVLAKDIERFFDHPLARTGPAPKPKDAAKEAALEAQVKADLVKLRAIEGAMPQAMAGLR